MYGFSLVQLLVLILICAILKQDKMVSKIQVRMSATNMYLHQRKNYSHLQSLGL